MSAGCSAERQLHRSHVKLQQASNVPPPRRRRRIRRDGRRRNRPPAPNAPALIGQAAPAAAGANETAHRNAHTSPRELIDINGSSSHTYVRGRITRPSTAAKFKKRTPSIEELALSATHQSVRRRRHGGFECGIGSGDHDDDAPFAIYDAEFVIEGRGDVPRF